MSKIIIRGLIVKIFYKKIIFLILFFTIEVSYAEQNYQWVKISPNSWDNKYSKVRSLAFFDQKLCAGLGEASFGDADIYCYSFKKRIWTQIGGDGLNGGWKNHNKVNTLLSHQGKLFAGLGENVAGLYVK